MIPAIDWAWRIQIAPSADRFQGGAGFRWESVSRQWIPRHRRRFEESKDFVKRRAQGHFAQPQPGRANFGGGRSAFGGIQGGGVTRMQSDHGFSSMGHAGGGFGGGGVPWRRWRRIPRWRRWWTRWRRPEVIMIAKTLTIDFCCVAAGSAFAPSKTKTFETPEAAAQALIAAASKNDTRSA